MLVAILGLACPARAQLISPGKLSRAHAGLEGMRQCTQCHTLGERGVSAALCLRCHTVLRTRVEAGRGYHAGLADQGCATCHKEHLGRDFALVRLDTAAFDHARTGYPLEGAHQRAACRDCHRPQNILDTVVVAYARRTGSAARTMLGLSTACRTCHAPDDPHGGQFRGQSCSTCHTPATWRGAERFDHGRTRYPLTGRHRQVACSDCHRPTSAGDAARVRYVGLNASSCASCHRDPHQGAMQGTCADCHQTAGWRRLDRSAVAARFDHDRTRFPLVGRHAGLDCSACHAPTGSDSAIHIRLQPGSATLPYPRPVAGDCRSCHVDYHQGELAGMPAGAACSRCHGQDGWTPVSYDLNRHAAGPFPLTGAHRATPCNTCHDGGTGGRVRLRLPTTCGACHRADDPHQGRYGDRACDVCHGTDNFRDAGFDHARIATGETCVGCHGADDPHHDQFAATSCQVCHGTGSFRIARFDHSHTRFPLEGAHRQAPCTACHRLVRGADGRSFRRYRPMPTTCTACHGGKS